MSNRLEEIKNEVAEKFEFADWNDLRYFHILNDVPGLYEIENDVVATYTEECCKASLEKASKQLFGIFIDDDTELLVRDANKYCDSITNPDNIIIL